MVKAVSRWSLWRTSPYAVIVILAVDLAAVGTPLASIRSIEHSDLWTAALLGSLSIVYSRFTVSWERARRALRQEKLPTLCPNLLATWAFAAAVLLPLTLAAVVITAAAIAEWPARNIAGQATPYRYVYSTAGAILAATAANSCMTLAVPEGVALALAVAGYMLVGMAAVALAMVAAGQYKALTLLLKAESHKLEVLTIGLAVAQVQLINLHIPLAWLSLPAAIVIQRGRSGTTFGRSARALSRIRSRSAGGGGGASTAYARLVAVSPRTASSSRQRSQWRRCSSYAASSTSSSASSAYAAVRS